MTELQPLPNWIRHARFAEERLDKAIIDADKRIRMVSLWRTAHQILSAHGEEYDSNYKGTQSIPLEMVGGINASIELHGSYLSEEDGEARYDESQLSEIWVAGVISFKEYEPLSHTAIAFSRSFEADELGYDFETNNEDGRYLDEDELQRGERVMGVIKNYFSSR